MQACWRILVSGRVQGVFFRVYTQKQADKLGLSGLVRNLSSGDVEIIACGGEHELAALRDWCYQGSPKSQVSQVEVEVMPPSDGFLEFTIQ